MARVHVPIAFVVFAIFLLMSSCSDFENVNGSSPVDADDASTSDVRDSAPSAVDSSDGPTCSQNGAAACDKYIVAWCLRLLECCTPGGACTCAEESCSISRCKAYQISQGFDCSAPRFSGRTVCEEKTKACTNDVPLIACADLTGGTANRPASCDAFVAQFP